MHAATFAAFHDELQKLGFDVMHAAAQEGIQLAKKLKSTGAAQKLRGAPLKDYMHHMDLSAHPKFAKGVKTTVQGMPKTGSGWSHAAELGGLGILAAPSVQHLRGKEMSEKNKSRAEIAGLGVLAAPTAATVAKKGLGMLKKVKRASVKKQAALFGVGGGFRNAAANASSMAMRGMQGGGKSLAGNAAVGAAKRLAPQAPRAIPTAAQVGGHAFKPATTGKYAPIAIPGLT